MWAMSFVKCVACSALGLMLRDTVSDCGEWAGVGLGSRVRLTVRVRLWVRFERVSG